MTHLKLLPIRSTLERVSTLIPTNTLSAKVALWRFDSIGLMPVMPGQAGQHWKSEWAKVSDSRAPLPLKKSLTWKLAVLTFGRYKQLLLNSNVL